MNIGLEQIFFYRRDKKGQQVNENVLNITNIRKMQIKMTMNVHHKKKTNGKDVEKRQLLYAVGGNINWFRHNRKQHRDS